MAEAEIVIKAKAGKLLGHYRWNESDREDLQQELWLAVLEAWRKHDPARGPHMALAHVKIKSAVIDMIKERKAELRDYRRLSRKSLSRKTRDEEGYPMRVGELLPTDIHDRRLGTESRRNLLADIDVQCVVATLTGELRELAEMLMTYTKSETARLLGIPRSSLYRRIEKLEVVFRRADVVPAHARRR